HRGQGRPGPRDCRRARVAAGLLTSPAAALCSGAAAVPRIQARSSSRARGERLLDLSLHTTSSIRSPVRPPLHSRGAMPNLVRAFHKGEHQVSRYVLPDLPYDYGALEPHLSGKIMQLHHDKHHRTYVDTANQCIDKLIEIRRKRDFETIAALEHKLAFNVSGHVLHSLFWQNLAP